MVLSHTMVKGILVKVFPWEGILEEIHARMVSPLAFLKKAWKKCTIIFKKNICQVEFFLRLQKAEKWCSIIFKKNICQVFFEQRAGQRRTWSGVPSDLYRHRRGIRSGSDLQQGLSEEGKVITGKFLKNQHSHVTQT